MENTDKFNESKKNFQKPGLTDKLGNAVEKAGEKISDMGGEKVGQKIHDWGDRLEKRHEDPSHPRKV